MLPRSLTPKPRSPQTGPHPGQPLPRNFCHQKKVTLPDKPCPHSALPSGVPTSDKRLWECVYIIHDSEFQGRLSPHLAPGSWAGALTSGKLLSQAKAAWVATSLFRVQRVLSAWERRSSPRRGGPGFTSAMQPPHRDSSDCFPTPLSGFRESP